MAKQGKRTGKYRSRFEANIALSLQCKGIKFTFEEEKITYTKHYIPDFRLENGIIIEAKGLFDSEDRTKHLALKREHPELDIRFCFMNAKNKLGKGSSTTYAAWCDKHGIPWCEKQIPNEWLK